LITKFNSVGLKDMHPMQIQALVSLIELSLDLASHFEEEDVIREVEEKADNLIRLLGGNGVMVELE